MRGWVWRGVWVALVFVALAAAGCAETVRCPDGQIFDEDGECINIRDGGPALDSAP